MVTAIAYLPLPFVSLLKALSCHRWMLHTRLCLGACLIYACPAGKLVGDALLAAAFVSYAGPFNMEFRKRLVSEKWLPDLTERQIPLTSGFMPLDMLADESSKVCYRAYAVLMLCSQASRVASLWSSVSYLIRSAQHWPMYK